MAEQNHGARRRKAFAEFKENQYDDAFSLSASQKKKKTAGRIVRWILIVVLTIAFILIGFVVTDALLDISQQPYHDPNTYTPKFVNTTTTVTTTTTTSATQETDEDEANASYDEDEETDAEDTDNTENTEDTDDTENTENTEDTETDEDNADSENTDDTEEAD